METSQNSGIAMRYNSRRTHRPSSKRMDTKTGEVQEMILDAQVREKLVDYFKSQFIIDKENMATIEKIYFNSSQPTPEMLAQVSKRDSSIVLLYFHYDDRASTTLLLGALFSVVNEIDDRSNLQILKLEKQIQLLSEKTGVDNSDMKAELEAVKGTVNDPIARINNYLTEREATRAQQKKLEDEILDRSH